jgi:predicted nucleic acid-binding protein
MADEAAYIDTSVLGAYYCPEALSTRAEEALRQIGTPVISTLSEVEFCSLISRKRRLGELTQRQSREIIDLFSNHVAEGFYRRLSLDAEQYRMARQLLSSNESALVTLDALHLSAALADAIPIMTADRDLARAAKQLKASVILIK